jgi:hypothetical protein
MNKSNKIMIDYAKTNECFFFTMVYYSTIEWNGMENKKNSSRPEKKQNRTKKTSNKNQFR